MRRSASLLVRRPIRMVRARACKKVLGQEFYPHYFRLRKLSKIGMNREKGSITHLKAVSGIKRLKALEAYLGYDQETQDEAMELSE